MYDDYEDEFDEYDEPDDISLYKESREEDSIILFTEDKDYRKES